MMWLYVYLVGLGIKSLMNIRGEVCRLDPDKAFLNAIIWPLVLLYDVIMLVIKTFR